jgi:L-ascorbate metabolism protein UlaG (beta-lactamase superfamily)
MNLAWEILNRRIPKDQLAVWWLGMAGFAFKIQSGQVILVDPYFSDFVPQPPGWIRQDSSPLDFRQVAADFILFTHDDFDHFDRPVLPTLARALPNLHFVGPGVCCDALRELGIRRERILEVNQGEKVSFGSLAFQGQPAIHTAGAIGLVVDFNPGRVYVVGDTVWDDRLCKVPDPLDLLVTPTTPPGYDNLSVEEAVRLTACLVPRAVIPCHYGTFQVFDADPQLFAAKVEALCLPIKALVLHPGEGLNLDICP